MTDTAAIHTRYMIRQDCREALAFATSDWTYDVLLHHLRQRHGIGMVAEDETDRIRGFMVYDLCVGYIEVVALFGDEEGKRALMQKVRGKVGAGSEWRAGPGWRRQFVTFRGCKLDPLGESLARAAGAGDGVAWLAYADWLEEVGEVWAAGLARL